MFCVYSSHDEAVFTHPVLLKHRATSKILLLVTFCRKSMMMKLNQDAVQDQIPPQSGEEVRRLLPSLTLSHVSALVQSRLIFIFTLSSQTSLPQPQGGSTNFKNNRQRSQYMERLNSIYDHFNL